MFDLFGKLFSNNKQNQGNIDIKNVSHSIVNVLQVDKLDLSSFINSPYQNVIIGNSLRKNSLSSLSDNISYRNKTVENIVKTWENKVWLNIQGGFDTGKTQLSLLIDKYLSRENILNYNFKDVSTTEFQNIIVPIFSQVLSQNNESFSNSEKGKLIILDDLPEFGIDENVNLLFIQFVAYCKANNIKVLSTSNYRIHSKITKGIKDDFIGLQIPLLTKEEIEEVILSYRNDNSLRKFSTIIEVISIGYPMYVQIICKYLEVNNWNISDENLMNFISGKPFDELDSETYQKLFNSTQDEDSRGLLYRLNIVSGVITNEIIEIVSNIKPIIHNPFEKLKNLNGTWLQKNSDSTFFISPLIKRLGSNNVTVETRKEINNSLAKNILKKKTISQYEGQSAFTYFLLGESFDDAGIIMITGLQTYFTNPEIYLGSLFQSMWINSDLPIEMSPLIKLSIRSLQLYICNDLQFKNDDRYNQNNRNFVRNHLETILQNNLELVPIEVVSIAYLMLFRSYLQENDVKQSLYFLIKLNESSFETPDKADEVVTANFWSVLDKTSKLEDIKIWFETFDVIGKQEIDYDKNLIHLFSRRLMDNIIDKNKDNWSETIKILEYIIQECNTRKLELLRAYSSKSKIFILADKYKDMNKAEVFYNEIKNYLSNPEAVFVVKDEFGRQQFYSGDKENALITLLEIEDVDILSQTKLDTYITIAKIFGEKDKNIAHFYTNRAFEYAESNKDLKLTKLTLAKLMAECATSFWFLGDYKSAIYKLSEAYEYLIKSYKETDLFDDIEDFNIVVLRIGSVLNFIYQTLMYGKPPDKVADGSVYPLPQRGIFSSSFESIMLNEWYYDERKYMNMYIFVKAFEYFGDKENAIKWANYSFELDNEIKLYAHKHTLRIMLGYMLMQNKYQESIEIEKGIESFENELNEEQANEIQNKLQREAFLKMLEEYKSKPKLVDDDYYFTFNIIPIVLIELTLLLENKIQKNDLITNIKEHLNKNESIFEDKEALKSILYLFDNFPTNSVESKSLLDWVSNIESENKRPIQIIAYLICSLNASSSDALKLHFAVMPYLEKVIRGISKGSHLFILYPFVYKFWTSRVLLNPQDFYFLNLWQKNLERSTKVKNKFKVIAIYALVCMHLSQRPNQIEESWIQEYIDYIRKNN